ncbi:lipoyltransferase [Novosphingobium sp. 1949]|uniref:Lipoyltransferase n=1 Tax=Novosphingobium organovorum TaxID=2930092 RepID=A0ABT0BH47_9SPHN|nr:lipoyltransferase [Novosphingobium organovorum]MCJ2184111.1 lipoyltransferase [Novosphingobium organovorum]
MRFDSNQAWSETVAVVRRNLEVLMAVGGVFFLLPALLSTVFLSDIQLQIMAAAKDETALEALLGQHIGVILAFAIGGSAVQFVGYLACTVLLTNRARPTVGQALATALARLPALFVATILCGMGIALVVSVVSVVMMGLGGALGGGAQALGALVSFVAMLSAMLYTFVRFSLLIPVMIRDGLTNPLAALMRSWQLTAGNTLRLLGFYTLLMIAYLAINILLSLFIMTPVQFVLGAGQAATFVAGVVTGAIAAVWGVLLTGVLTRIHAQLTSGTAEGQADMFR